MANPLDHGVSPIKQLTRDSRVVGLPLRWQESNQTGDVTGVSAGDPFRQPDQQLPVRPVSETDCGFTVFAKTIVKAMVGNLAHRPLVCINIMGSAQETTSATQTKSYAHKQPAL